MTQVIPVTVTVTFTILKAELTRYCRGSNPPTCSHFRERVRNRSCIPKRGVEEDFAEMVEIYSRQKSAEKRRRLDQVDGFLQLEMGSPG